MLNQKTPILIRMPPHKIQPLTANIMGYLDVLRTDIWDTLPDEQRTEFTRIQVTSERMQNLTQDILSVEHIEAAASDQQELVDLCALVETTFEQNQVQAEQKAQHYDLEMPETPLMVRADSAQMHEAI